MSECTHRPKRLLRARCRTGPRAAFVAGLGLLAFATTGVAIADVAIGFDPSMVEFNRCREDDPVIESVSVGITVDAAAVDLRGMSIVIDYEPDYVQPIAVEAGSLLQTCAEYHVEWLGFTVGDTTIAVDAVGLGCSVDGPGDYIRITFQNVGIEDYLTTLTCESVILRNSENVTLPHTCGEGMIRCTGPVPAEEYSWTAIKARFRTPGASP